MFVDKLLGLFGDKLLPRRNNNQIELSLLEHLQCLQGEIVNGPDPRKVIALVEFPDLVASFFSSSECRTVVG